MNNQDNWVDDAHRYRLDSRIAAGGMGEVWRATDTALGREVAVKLLKAELADDPLFRSRFESEARHAAALSHPGVAAVYDVGESSGDRGTPRPYLVMELVDGQPLNNLLRPGARMDPTAVRELLAQVGDALGAAHRAGIVHRDVKPGNLLVTPDRRVKVTDFGIARAAEAVALTQTGQVMGTPQYLSPEQAEGKHATAASDVYSLGVVAYECLAGRRPFEAESAIATALAHLRNPVPPLPDTVPSDLAAVVMRALSKKPEDRFANGDEFAAALRDPATAALTLPVGDDMATQVNPAVGTGDPGTQVMPATTATPVTDPETGAYAGRRIDPEAGHKVRWPVVAGVVLVGAVLLALLAWWALRDGGDDRDPAPTPSETPSASPTDDGDEPETVRVDPDDYVGRDARDVIEELRLLGLRVQRDPQPNNGDRTPFEVTDVDPSGSLERGDRVTVTYWAEAPKEEPTPTPTRAPEPEPTPTPTPTRAPEPTPTETPEPTPTETPTPTESEPAPESDSAPALLPGGQR